MSEREHAREHDGGHRQTIMIDVTPRVARLVGQLFNGQERRIMGALEDFMNALTTANTATHDEIGRVNDKLDEMGGTIADGLDHVADLTTAVEAATAKVAELQAIIDAGFPSQADLEAAKAQIADLTTQLQTATEKVSAIESGLTENQSVVEGMTADLNDVLPRVPQNPPAQG